MDTRASSSRNLELPPLQCSLTCKLHGLVVWESELATGTIAVEMPRPRLANHDRIAIYSAVHQRDLGPGSKELLGSFVPPPSTLLLGPEATRRCMSVRLLHCPITMASCVHVVSVAKRLVRGCMLFVDLVLGIVVSFLTSFRSSCCLPTSAFEAANSIAASWLDTI
ncbi:hypothetical protein B0T10DRAFT_271299 [Thelonectria olida]|uniref:Uncharacterized protein n=1 Tax=Thelonectria olida TaxID=1576542 RepID=A0A9P8WBT0_9HYPO|nr:hypothetical protein B0T10DRAFT_271299 [Thelonectria olida]